MAKWIRPKNASKSSYKFICSDCGETAYCLASCSGSRITRDTKDPICGYRFCPYCGIRMEESKA